MKNMNFRSMVGTLVSPKLISNKFSGESGQDRSIRHKKIQSNYILGSRTKLASWITAGVTFLEAR